MPVFTHGERNARLRDGCRLSSTRVHADVIALRLI